MLISKKFDALVFVFPHKKLRKLEIEMTAKFDQCYEK
jgi:hypothetical protein